MPEIGKLTPNESNVLAIIAAGKTDDVIGRMVLRKNSSARRADQLVALGYLVSLGSRAGLGRVFEVTDIGREMAKTIKPRKK